MCLEARLTGQKKVEAIRKLPKEFPVWKYLVCDIPEYHQTGESKLQKSGIHKARNRPTHRSALAYKPGFHAFLCKGSEGRENLTKFWAKRSWVEEIGRFNEIHYHRKGVVLSHIEVRKTN